MPLPKTPETRLSTGMPGPDERASGGLEPEDGLALHEQDVLLRAEEFRHLALGAPEGLEEGGVVVIGDRCGLCREDPGGRHGRAGAEREDGIVHVELLSARSAHVGQRERGR